jgi:lathosterol oxidase
MPDKLIYTALYESSYWFVYLITLVYFLLLYFGIGTLFRLLCRQLYTQKLLTKIVLKDPAPEQVRYEIIHSLVSVVIFGFSGVALVYMIRSGSIEPAPDTTWSALTGLVILNLWNELHFFTVHRLMHLPWLYRTVHKVHHRSKTPTVYSVFSFHPFEAALLSTVPLTIAPFVDLSITALMLYPLTSILLNLAGHCNYRFGNGQGSSYTLFATRHAKHHQVNAAAFGFATALLDRIASKFKQP